METVGGKSLRCLCGGQYRDPAPTTWRKFCWVQAAPWGCYRRCYFHCSVDNGTWLGLGLPEGTAGRSVSMWLWATERQGWWQQGQGSL